jgi:hypothetical protein
MPRFEPIDRQPTGTFNLHMPNGPLHAHLTNVGGSTAVVESANLRHAGGVAPGLVWVDHVGPVSRSRRRNAASRQAGTW